MRKDAPTCLEFFAGGGLARLGMADHFTCTFANDIDPRKARSYRANFGDDHFYEGDVGAIDPSAVPEADLAWASFPCQDLSLAGARGGLNAKRSGAFWGFWRIIEHHLKEGCAPRLLVLENVTGLISSNGGKDFEELVSNLVEAGYTVGAAVIDAAHFVPQSRPRIFVVAHLGEVGPGMIRDTPHPVLHPPTLVRAASSLPDRLQQHWVWWQLPDPPLRNAALGDVIETDPPGSCWRDGQAMERLRGQMSSAHQKRLAHALSSPGRVAGAVYRRIRIEDCEKVQRAEIRYDGLAGCLRTPAGGSSKQLLVISENGEARLRPLLAREAARLMGCPDTYVLPSSETDGLKVMGDGVCVPVVRWLSEVLLSPLLDTSRHGLDADRFALSD